MKYAKVFGILLSVGMLFVSCREPVELGEPVHLFGHITQEPIALMDYLVCDGEQTLSYRVPSESKVKYHEEIFSNLQKVEARPVLTSEMPEVTYPIYSVFALDEGEAGENVEFAWSDGYLYNRDGTVYAFDFDFDSLIDDYGMTYREERDVKEGVSMKCRYYIAQDTDGWKKKWLNPAEERMISEEIILTDAVFSDGILSFSFTNSGERTMRAGGTDYSLHVKLDGIWYLVPTLPGTVIWDYIPEIPAGETYEQVCRLRDHYGDLPSGTYRVETDVWAKERGSESTAVYHEFTIE